jgi:hypothetical protein
MSGSNSAESGGREYQRVLKNLLNTPHKPQAELNGGLWKISGHE